MKNVLLISFSMLIANVKVQSGTFKWTDSPERTSSLRSTALSSKDQDLAADWISFDQFQPAGDGVTNDSPKLIQALQQCISQKAGLLINPAKAYLLATPINFEFTGNVAIKSSLEGKSAIFYLPDSDQTPVYFSAKSGSLKTTLGKEIKIGDRIITLASTSGLKPGDLIVIQSNVDWPIETGTKKGEYNVVESVSGQTVTVKQRCQDSYSVSEVQAVTNYSPARLELQDIEFNVKKTGDKPVMGLGVSYMQNSFVNRIQIKNAQKASSQFYGCYDTEIANSQFENANEEGEGYGIATVGGLLYDIHDNRSFGCRKLCDFSSNGRGGPTRNSRAVGNEALGEGVTNLGNDLFTRQSFCIATHGGAEGIVIDNNTAVNCQTGFQLRGRDITLNNNQILGKSITPIALSNGQNHVVTNNVYQSLLTGKTATHNPTPDYSSYPKACIAFGDAMLPNGYIVIKNNSFDFVRNYGIYAYNVTQRCLIQNNHFEFNTLGGGEDDPVMIYWDEVKAPLIGLRVRDNTYQFGGKTALTNMMYVERDANSYPVGPVIDWSSCEVQGLRASDVLTLTTNSGEAPYQQFIKGLSVTKKDDTFALTGNFDFTFQAATQPMLSGLPHTNTQTNQYFTFSVEPNAAVYTGKIDGATGKALFGAQANVFGQSFTGGRQYFIGLNLSYKTQ